MEQSKIDRISQLTQLSRQRPLTQQEQVEREALRREYIEAMKESLKSQLDHTLVIDENGRGRRLKQKPNT